jgi:hypothetical protein
MTLTDFLQARIDEDEKAAQTKFTSRRMIGGKMVEIPIPSRSGTWAWSPDRVLAECEAKRLIVALHTPYERVYCDHSDDYTMKSAGTACEFCDIEGDGGEPEPEWYPCRHLRLLALPYADHPDYQEGWRL